MTLYRLTLIPFFFRVSFRKKKSSKNADATTPKGAEAAPSPAEKAIDDAREPDVSFYPSTFSAYCFSISLSHHKFILNRPPKPLFHLALLKWKTSQTYSKL